MELETIMITNSGITAVGKGTWASIADSCNVVWISTENPSSDSAQHQSVKGLSKKLRKERSTTDYD